MHSFTPNPFLLLSALLLTQTAGAQIAFTPVTNLLPGGGGNPACVVDMNGDHLDDVVRFNGLQLVINFQQPDGSFIMQTFGSATVNPNWSICAGDLNGNGYNDLLIGNGSANSFMYAANDGASYSEVYYPAYIFSQRTNMADIDNDGHLDAFSCHDVGLSKPYRNPGNGGPVVEDQSLIQQVTSVGGNYASIFVDYDNDGDPDLYITKCRSGAPVGDPQRINLLYRNNGDGTWTEVGAAAGINDGAQSWSTVFEDFDNDGDFDAFIVNHTDLNRFMINNGDGTFTDIIATTGIAAGDLGAWESQGADFDNDGFVDIFSEVGGGMYRNNGNLTFTNINLPVDEGAIGDLNNDGWLDYQIGSTVYMNNGGTNHWIKVALQGIISNNNGIGSRLWLYGSWGVQTREIRSGQGFSHMNTLQGHFGIGQATSIDSLVIEWPSGMRTVLENPAIDQLHIVPEAACTAAPITIAANGPTSICNGQTVELEAPAGFVNYIWSNGASGSTITVSQSGNYSVAAFDTDNCAALSNTITVTATVETAPVISSVGETTFCAGGTVELVSTPALSYQWSTGETTPSIVVSAAGSYTVTVQGPCSTLGSDPVEVVVLAQAADPVSSDVSIPVPGTATLVAAGDNILWYAGQLDQNPVGDGNSWDTPFVSSTTSFWCEANAIYGGALETGGKPDNSGGGGLPSSGSHSFFNAWEPFTLQSVTVYAYGAGMRTIALYDGNGNVLETTDVQLVDGQQVVTLNFEVPIGNGMSLRCPQHNLFRNNSGVAYPYAIGTVGELYNSGFGTSYYYYFYDWKTRKSSITCPSDRVEVQVFVGSVGIGRTDATDGLSLMPNPANEAVVVNGTRPGDRIVIRDVSGRVVLDLRADASPMRIDLARLSKGSYTVTVENSDLRWDGSLIISR